MPNNDLTNKKISLTYGRLVQYENGQFYDGLGNQLNLGSVGATGQTGEKGATGADGMMGPTGATGADGSSSLEIISITYSYLQNLKNNSLLEANRKYLIEDFKTCYDQPDYDQFGSAIAPVYKDSIINPIIVIASSTSSLMVEAFDTIYPSDYIKYDIDFSQTEINAGTAFGRITERIDSLGNRTDYDHRNIVFKRYRSIYFNTTEKLTGTVELQPDGSIVGSGTNFLTSGLTFGSLIALPNSTPFYYQVISIDSDTAMGVTGLDINSTAPGETVYKAYYGLHSSYKRNNIEGNTNYEESTTFGSASEAYGNYIGDYSIFYLEKGIGDFLLSNNVLKSGSVYNNTFGNIVYNNSFCADTIENKVGNSFYNNTFESNFKFNNLGNQIYSNFVRGNFNNNSIQNKFVNNTIFSNGFYGFYANTINNNFQNNLIGNSFDFYFNQIGPDFSDNFIYNSFSENIIKLGFSNNVIHSSFYENNIGGYFTDNNLLGSLSSFNYNLTLIGFTQNNIFDDFISNSIFNSLYNNIINSFNNNSVNQSINNNIFTASFLQNSIDSTIAGFDFSTSTHVYQAYNCKIFTDSLGNTKLYYITDSGTLSFHNITD